MSEEPRRIKIYHNAGTVTIRIPADIVKDIGITTATKKAIIRRPDKNKVELIFDLPQKETTNNELGTS